MPIEDLMNSEEHTDVLTKKVTPEMARRFPAGSGVFQHDWTPCHTSRKAKNVLALNSISVLDRPGNSPDLNSIEDLCSIIKFQLLRKGCTTMVKLIEVVTECRYRGHQI